MARSARRIAGFLQRLNPRLFALGVIGVSLLAPTIAYAAESADECSRFNPACWMKRVGAFAFSFVAGKVIDALAALFRVFADFSALMISFTTPLFESFALAANQVTTIPDIKNLWMIFRDLANGLLIVALLAAAVMVILQKANYTVKKVIPNLIMAVFMINFSRLAIQLMIDAFHVITVGIYQLVSSDNTVTEGNIMAKLLELMNIKTILTTMSVKSGTGAEVLTNVQLLIATMFVLAILIVVMFSAVSLLLLYAERFIGLGLLVVASPLAFAAIVAPFGYTEKLRSAFWSKLIKYASMNVIVAANLGFAILVSNAFQTVAMSNSASSSSPQDMAGMPKIEWGTLVNLIVCLMLIRNAITAAKEGMYAEKAVDAVQKAGDEWAKKATIGSAKRVARPITNTAQNMWSQHKAIREAKAEQKEAARTKKYDDMALKTGPTGLYGRMMQQTLNPEKREKSFKENNVEYIKAKNGAGWRTSKDLDALVGVERDKIASGIENAPYDVKLKNLTNGLEQARKDKDIVRVKALLEATAKLGVKIDGDTADEVALRQKIGEVVGVKDYMDDTRYSKPEQMRVLQAALEGNAKYLPSDKNGATGSELGIRSQELSGGEKQRVEGDAKSKVRAESGSASRKAQGEIREQIKNEVGGVKSNALQKLAQYVNAKGELTTYAGGLSGDQLGAVLEGLSDEMKNFTAIEQQEVGSVIASLALAAHGSKKLSNEEVQHSLGSVKGVPALALVAREPTALGPRSAADIRKGGGDFVNHDAYRASIAELTPEQLIMLSGDAQFRSNAALTLGKGSQDLENKLHAMAVKTDGGIVSNANITAVKKLINDPDTPPTVRAKILTKINNAYNTVDTFKKAFDAEYAGQTVDQVFA